MLSYVTKVQPFMKGLAEWIQCVHASLGGIAGICRTGILVVAGDVRVAALAVAVGGEITGAEETLVVGALVAIVADHIAAGTTGAIGD